MILERRGRTIQFRQVVLLQQQELINGDALSIPDQLKNGDVVLVATTANVHRVNGLANK